MSLQTGATSTAAIIDGGETNIDVWVCGCAQARRSREHVETTVATNVASSCSNRSVRLQTGANDGCSSDLKTNGADGDVVLEDAIIGTAADDDAGDAVNANGAGDVLIRALDGSITANADVRSTDGNLSILGENRCRRRLTWTW